VHQQPAARAQHAPGLGQRAAQLGGRQVLHHVEEREHVGARVGQWEGAGVGQTHLRPGASVRRRERSARQRDSGGRVLHADGPRRAGAQRLHQQLAAPAAHVDQHLAGAQGAAPRVERVERVRAGAL
jgi:hypothetical protein